MILPMHVIFGRDMSTFSDREVQLITQARQDERSEILAIIEKFTRKTVLSDGDTFLEVKVPANHLKTIIEARGETVDNLLSGVSVATESE